MPEDRREFLKKMGFSVVAGAAWRSGLPNAASAEDAPSRPGGISLNYDNSHFFCWHRREEMNAAGVDAWVDQYADTQIDTLYFCLNSQRSSVASKARQSVWDGYDPKADDDQPFLAGVSPEPFAFLPDGPNQRQHMRNWAHNAWLLHDQGIDPYARWLARCRQQRISPWLSMRMNDIHYYDQPQHAIHDRFWKEHPEYRCDPATPGSGYCLDYGRPEVREYEFAFIREMVSRYDMDGFELDWLRSPFNFKPGREQESASIMTEFMAEVRRLLDERAKQLGHPVGLSARVPNRLETARRLGFDIAAWTERRLVDRLVVSPTLLSQESMPIEAWKQLIGERVTRFGAGLMVTIRPYNGSLEMAHTVETARGCGASLLVRGADHIYLFNFFDGWPMGVTPEHYRESTFGKAMHLMLQEIGSLKTIGTKSRRHVVTDDDFWAPGEPEIRPLPHTLGPGAKTTFQVAVGPAPQDGQLVLIRLAVADAGSGVNKWELRANGQLCEYRDVAVGTLPMQRPLHAFKVPATALRRGSNEFEVLNRSDAAAEIVWFEVYVSGPDGTWPDPHSLDCQEVAGA